MHLRIRISPKRFFDKLKAGVKRNGWVGEAQVLHARVDNAEQRISDVEAALQVVKTTADAARRSHIHI